MSDTEKENVDRAKRNLEEALTGRSPKSKNTLIKEALKALQEIK